MCPIIFLLFIICPSYSAALVSAFIFVFMEDLLTGFFWSIMNLPHIIIVSPKTAKLSILEHSSLAATQTKVDFL